MKTDPGKCVSVKYLSSNRRHRAAYSGGCLGAGNGKKGLKKKKNLFGGVESVSAQ